MQLTGQLGFEIIGDGQSTSIEIDLRKFPSIGGFAPGVLPESVVTIGASNGAGANGERIKVEGNLHQNVLTVKTTPPLGRDSRADIAVLFRFNSK
jgi:hypothetical protein